MVRKLPLLALLLAATLAAQETAEEAAEPAAVEADSSTENESPAAEVTDEEIEELLNLDEPWDEDAEDEFIPTENVKFEQSIPFPTDI